MEPMFDIPTSSDIDEVVINSDVVNEGRHLWLSTQRCQRALIKAPDPSRLLLSMSPIVQ